MSIGRSCQESDAMVEVWAAAQVIVLRYGHRKKFTKHIVALVIKQEKNLPDYGKSWAIERIFSRSKEVFGMSKNRFVGLKKISIHFPVFLLMQ